jgi:hypothetical protein
MSDINLADVWEPVQRRSPRGGVETYWRPRHDAIHSARLRRFDACIRDTLGGQRYRTDGAAGDAAAVHAALTRASRRCSQGVRDGQ